MEMRIRKAEMSDSAAIADFNIRMALETENKELDPDAALRGVKAIFKDQHKGFYLLMTMGGRIVGQLLVTPEWSDWRNKFFWWIQSVYVDPEFRGRRIFSLLFNHLKDKAQTARNVAGLRLYVDKTNKKAREVYRSCGMLPSHYVFYETEF
jgi:GNAT superfamily N-acetyltransferase